MQILCKHGQIVVRFCISVSVFLITEYFVG